MTIRLLYLSSVPLRDETGGSVVMYHHLDEHNDFEVLEINNLSLQSTKTSFLRRAVDTCFSRISRTRWHLWGHSYEQIWRYRVLPRSVLKDIRLFAPDVVLTVAHGNLFWLARVTAKRLQLPLVSIYHDWWPMLLQQSYSLRPSDVDAISRRFHQLYSDSDGVLCISEGMRRSLGNHPNSHILYPATSRQLKPILVKSATNPEDFRLLYSGNISASYGQKLRSLICTQPAESLVRLSVYGNPYDWPEADRNAACKKGIIKPFIPPDSFSETLSRASALLTVISFDPEVSKLMSTNFPSKIATYAAFGKPLVVWAPPYSTAAQFVRQHDCGLLIEDPSPEAVWQVLSMLVTNARQQEYLAEQALRLHRDILNPDDIHQKFVQHIEAVCSSLSRS